MTAILLNEPDGFPAEAVQRLSALGPVYRADQPYPAGEITAVLVRLREKIGAEFLRRHPSLRWVVSPTTGVDHLDLAHFDAQGVSVICLRGRTAFLDHIHATAEHTLALLLALVRRIPAAVQDVARGAWNRYPFQGTELHGKTVLILGYGRIGRQVHALYAAFGCRVLAHDTVAGRVPEALACTLDDGLARADIVSVHVSLDASTQGLVNEALLDRIRPGALLVNTSRGEIFDQPALLARVADGRLGGAALDVLAGEPTPLDENTRALLAACGPRLLVTPHIAGFTAESLGVVENHVTDLLIQAIQEA